MPLPPLPQVDNKEEEGKFGEGEGKATALLCTSVLLLNLPDGSSLIVVDCCSSRHPDLGLAGGGAPAAKCAY